MFLRRVGIMRSRALVGGLLPVGAVHTIVPSGSCLPFRIGLGVDAKLRRTLRIPGTGTYDTKMVGGRGRRPKVARLQ